MATETNRAADLVAEAFAAEQDYFSMDELLGDFDMPDFEPDARLRVANASYDFNYGAVQRAFREGTERPRVHGVPYVLTSDFENHDVVPNLARTLVSRHRAIGSENIEPVDRQKSWDETQLPQWDKDDPNQANVMRGLVASDPHKLHVLRGAYTYQVLAQQIWDGEIPTGCNVNVARDCDLNATSRDRNRAIYAMFSWGIGEFLVYFTICMQCFHMLCPMADGHHFYLFDPKYQTAESLEADCLRWKNWPKPKR